jgi:hypothetical protein
MGSRKGRTSGRSAREVTVSYRDQASSSSLSLSSLETVLEGDSSSRSPSILYCRWCFFYASCSRVLRT